MSEPTNAGRGRPALFNAERAAKVIEGLRYGMTRHAAAGIGGVSYDTFCRWIRRGNREESGDFCDFCAACRHAENEAEASMTAIIIQAARGFEAKTEQVRTFLDHEGREVTETTVTTRFVCEPRFALEWLKRRRPAEWGDQAYVRLSRLSDAELVAHVAGELGAIRGGDTVPDTLRIAPRSPYSDFGDEQDKVPG